MLGYRFPLEMLCPQHFLTGILQGRAVPSLLPHQLNPRISLAVSRGWVFKKEMGLTLPAPVDQTQIL